MNTIVINQTQRWIIESLLSSMAKKDYRDITIVEIVQKAELGRRTFYRYFKSKDEVLKLYCEIIIQDFAKKILEKEEQSLYSVSVSYFEFWNDHIDFLNLIKKNHMLYFFEENLPAFITKIALMVGHITEEDAFPSKPTDVYYDYYYSLHFNIGGYWRITLEWASKQLRETPEEMAVIITKIIFNQHD